MIDACHALVRSLTSAAGSAARPGMAVKLASSDLRELAASSKTFGSAFRFGPQLPTSVAALLIAARSETLCASIEATLVAACCSVTAVADGEAVGEVAVDPVSDAAGLAAAVLPPVPGDDPPGVPGRGPVLAASRRSGLLNGCAISTPATPPPTRSASRMPPQGQGRAGPAAPAETAAGAADRQAPRAAGRGGAM